MQQLYYIRLQNCPKGNITWHKPNITAKQYNSPKANITEKDSDCITIRVFFWQGQKDSAVCGARNSLTLSFARQISTAAPAFASLNPLFAALATAPLGTRFWRTNPFVQKVLISTRFSTPRQLLTPTLTTKQVERDGVGGGKRVYIILS